MTISATTTAPPAAPTPATTQAPLGGLGAVTQQMKPTVDCRKPEYKATAHRDESGAETRREIRGGGIVKTPCQFCGGQLQSFNDQRAAFGAFRVECASCGDYYDQPADGSAPLRSSP